MRRFSGLPGFFGRPDVLLASDLDLPLPFHPLPDLPGQTDRQPCPFLKAHKEILRRLHGLADCLKNEIPLTDLRILLPEIRHRIPAGDLAGRLTL